MTVSVRKVLLSRLRTKRPTARMETQKTRSQNPSMMPAMVRFPIRQTLGVDDGLTLSVADDRAKKSPATIISTISNGVSTAVPEMISPASKNSTCTTLWTIDRNVYVRIRWNVVRPSCTAATMPPRPGSVSTMPAAYFATSVAVNTAIPI